MFEGGEVEGLAHRDLGRGRLEVFPATETSETNTKHVGENCVISNQGEMAGKNNNNNNKLKKHQNDEVSMNE